MTSLGDSAALAQSARASRGFRFLLLRRPRPLLLPPIPPKRTPAARPPFIFFPLLLLPPLPEPDLLRRSERERERETLSKEKKGSFSPLLRPADSLAFAFGPAWRQGRENLLGTLGSHHRRRRR